MNSMSCLIQLAGINGPVFDSKEMKFSYICTYMRELVEFLNLYHVFNKACMHHCQVLRMM